MPTPLRSIISGHPAQIVAILAGIIAAVYLGTNVPLTTSVPDLPLNNMAAAAAIKFLTVPSVNKHTATVIFIHVRTSLDKAFSR